MIITLIAIILFIIFTVLGGFHFYWFFGGTWGLNKVIPSKGDQASTLQIPKLATLVVALGLVSFGIMYLMKAGLVTFSVPTWILTYGYWFIPAIFILRAIGEFNYVGFFKKVKHSEFAKADTKIFAPLCLFIGVLGILIQWLA